jgi:hypothetical protein
LDEYKEITEGEKWAERASNGSGFNRPIKKPTLQKNPPRINFILIVADFGGESASPAP